MKSVYLTTQNWAEQRELAIRPYDEIGSTNDEAKKDAAELSDQPCLYIADHQTHGRGRGQNTWLDTGAGESLLSSWSFHLDRPPQATTGPRIGDALYRTAVAVWPSLDWSVKPPNDLYLGEKKIAGLLVETVSQGSTHRLIIGLGMNILNHPRKIGNAGHLGATGGNFAVGEAEWYQFLDVIFSQFKMALDDVVLPNLSQDIRNSLLKAINSFPGKKDEYLGIEANGDLVTRAGKIPWMVQ